VGETKELARIHESQKAVVVGIALEKDAEYLRRFVESAGIKYPVALGDEDLFTQFNGYAIPYTVILDRAGVIRKMVHGRIAFADLAKAIDDIDRGAIALAEALPRP
jgi:hypothetical protein